MVNVTGKNLQHMVPKNPTITNLKKLLANQAYSITEERLVQDKIEQVLNNNNIIHLREAQLTKQDRIDFLVGTIGIEVKLKAPPTQMIRQLHRYAQSDLISHLLLVTTSPKLQQMPKEFNGKPIHTLLLITALI